MHITLRAPIVIHVGSPTIAWAVYVPVSLVRSAVIGLFTLYAAVPPIASPNIREAVHFLGVVLAAPVRLVGLFVPALRSAYYPLFHYSGFGALDYAAMERRHVLVTTLVWLCLFLLFRFVRLRFASQALQAGAEAS